MELFNFFSNLKNATFRHNQEFERLIQAKDIGRAMNQMECKDKEINEAIREYNPKTHNIMKREDKLIFDEEGYYERTEKRWKLPIPYQPFINEISLVFLYGRPIRWTQKSKGTDNAFLAFKELLTKTHFDSKIRQCKRLAGAETQSAMLFRVFRNKKGLPDVQIRILAKSKGDDVRVRWDQYENIIDTGWGYYLKEEGRTVLHFDIFTPDVIYRCKRVFMGWEVIEEENIIGKIPMIIFQQATEHAGVEPMIEREEFLGSRTADTNDYFADPILLLASNVIKNMPDKKEEAKILIAEGIDDIKKAAHLMTWDSAPESKEKEVEWLQDHIMTKSFTPQIDFKTMKGLSNVSAKALKQMMLLADIKAAKHKESHDELLNRIAGLCASIIGNVLDISLKSECEELDIEHAFQEPFGEDVAEAIVNLAKAYDSEIMSQETAVEKNPLVSDPVLEMARLKKEQKERSKQQQLDNDDMFKSGDDDIFPATK